VDDMLCVTACVADGDNFSTMRPDVEEFLRNGAGVEAPYDNVVLYLTISERNNSLNLLPTSNFQQFPGLDSLQ
jgi:hypothetical protein